MPGLSEFKDLLEPLLQIFAIFVAAATVVWQVGKQHKGEIFLQKENLKTEFKIKLHNEIEDKISQLSDDTVYAGGIRWGLNIGFAAQQAAIAAGLQPIPLNPEMSEFNATHNKLMQNTIEVIKTIEKYEIVEPGIKIFQTAFNSASTNVRNAYSPLMQELLNILPQRSPDGQSIVYKPMATPAQIARVKQLAEKYWEATDEVGSYVYDFRVEIQNTLLGSLFEHRVPKRKPLDPRYIVISTDPESVVRLEKYFYEETAWGKGKQEAEARVKAALKK